MNALAFTGSNYLFTMLRSAASRMSASVTTKQSNSCRPHRRHGPGSGPSAWTLSTRNFAGKVMLLRRSGMLTLQYRNMRRSPGTTSPPWGPSPSSPTFIIRVTARKTARLPSSSWGWPRPALWPTNSLRSEARFNFKPVFLRPYRSSHGSSRRALPRNA